MDTQDSSEYESENINIFEGDDFNQVSGILKEKFEECFSVTYDDLPTEIHDLSEKEEIEFWSNVMNKKYESLKNVIEETFYTRPEYSGILKTYVDGSLPYLKEVVPYLDSDEIYVLKGWLIYDYIKKFVNILQVKQAIRNEEIEEVDFIDPGESIEKIIDMYTNFLDRLGKIKGSGY